MSSRPSAFGTSAQPKCVGINCALGCCGMPPAALPRLSSDQADRAFAILAEKLGVAAVRDAMLDAVAESAVPTDAVECAVSADGAESAVSPDGVKSAVLADGIDGGRHHDVQEAENAQISTGMHEQDNENDHEMTEPASDPPTAKRATGMRRLRQGPDGIYRTERAMKHWRRRNRRKQLQRDLTTSTGNSHVAERQTGGEHNA